MTLDLVKLATQLERHPKSKYQVVNFTDEQKWDGLEFNKDGKVFEASETMEQFIAAAKRLPEDGRLGVSDITMNIDHL